jgi:spore maturation protein CgeB
VFYERDVPYYRAHRDDYGIPGGRLCLYEDWSHVAAEAARDANRADLALVTSYCPDAVAASRLVLESSAPLRGFYDLDTPVTLARMNAGARVEYLPPEGLADFDVVLSFTGGTSLAALRTALGAKRVLPLYGSVDPLSHRPVSPQARFESDFSYLGTYSPDRQDAFERLFLRPASELPERSFLLGGSQYPAELRFPSNVRLEAHVPPAQHSAFYCSSPLTLNVTRAPMAMSGWCPSGRLFEAAACGVPVLSDSWPGLADFFDPGKEILIARSSEEALDYVRRPRAELARVGVAARARALSQHTGRMRARELVELVGRTSFNATQSSRLHQEAAACGE